MNCRKLPPIFILVVMSLSLRVEAVQALASPAGPGLHYIGSARQFFFDEDIVETLERSARRLNVAEKVTPNPVLRRDRSWEGPDMRLSWVIFDRRLGKFRMRYSSGVFRTGGRDEKGKVIVLGEGDATAAQRITCEAVSSDGVNWEKPSLGLVEYQGSKANNIVPEAMAYGYFFEDLHDSDPARRYKSFTRAGTYQGKGMTFSYFYSADAYHWFAGAGNPVIDTGQQVGRWGPTDFLGWDPIRKVYAVHMENNFHMHSAYARRSIGRAESLDMVHWSEPETIVVADNLDYPDTEFYAMPTAFHEGWYLGSLWIFSTTNTTHEPQFVFSRDGVNYNRMYRQPIISRGDQGDFDAVSIYANEPLVYQDKVFYYYTGTNWRSPEQLLLLGDKAAAGIGLATLPRDGFVSLEGARHEWSVATTRSLTFSGKNLYLNLQAALQQWGAEPCEVRVELLDGRLNPLPGYSVSDADPLVATSLEHRVSWRGNADIAALAGRPMRLKIYFKNAKLYSFQFR